MVLSICGPIVAKMLHMNRKWKERPISEVLQLDIHKRPVSSASKRTGITFCREAKRPFREPSEIAEDIESPSEVFGYASVVDPAPVITVKWSNWNLSVSKILKYCEDHIKRTCDTCRHSTGQPPPDYLCCLDSGFIQPLSQSHIVEKFTTGILPKTPTENLNKTLKTAQILTNSAEAFDPASGYKFADDLPVEAAHTWKSDAKAPIKGFLQGSISQAHWKFQDNAGKQCVANSLAAVIMNELKSITTWTDDTTGNDVDSVLEEGDRLYSYLKDIGEISGESGFLFIEELPDVYIMKDVLFKIKHGPSFYGFVGVYEEADDVYMREIQLPLYMAIRRALRDHGACFVTFNCSTCTIVKQGDHFAVFDPHCRNRWGFVAEKGTAVVVYHSEYARLYEHLENLAQQLVPYNSTLETMPFEVTGVKVSITSNMMPHSEETTTNKLSKTVMLTNKTSVHLQCRVESNQVYLDSPNSQNKFASDGFTICSGGDTLCPQTLGGKTCPQKPF